MEYKKTEFPSSPYLVLRGLDRMVLFAASCISNPNPGSESEKKLRTFASDELSKRVQRECLERNEDAPQADAIYGCMSSLIENGYLQSDAENLYVMPAGHGIVDRPYSPASLSVEPTPCSLRDAVTKVHELLREIGSDHNAYRWDPRVNQGQVLRRVLTRWAQEIGLSQDSFEQALKVVVQCGCINVIPCTISTLVDFLLGWAPLSDGQCKADRLVQLWESAIPKSSTETNEFPREPSLLRQFLYRLVASTEVPLSERATRYPTIETRDVSRAWAEKQGWPRFGLLLEDGLAVIQELLGKDEGIAKPNLSTPPPKKLLAFARAQPWHFKNNAEKTLYATEFPYTGPLADAFFELLETDAIKPTELRFLDDSSRHNWCGPVFRIATAIFQRVLPGPVDAKDLRNSTPNENRESVNSRSKGNKRTPLTNLESAILQHLEGRLLNEDHLVKLMDGALKSKSVRSLVMSIRKKLGSNAIATSRGRGYYRPECPPADLYEPISGP